MEPMAFFWLVLMVICLVVEGSTAAITSIWFAAGALVAMVASLLRAELWLQVALFTGVSIALLLCLRPMLKKYITPKQVRTNVESVIGSQGVVIQPIDNIAGTGRVKLGALEWAARSSQGNTIPEGTVVKAVKVEGVKVFVETVTADIQ